MVVSTSSAYGDVVRQRNADKLERLAWLHIIVSMLTQVSAPAAFPAYNSLLGFWACYCSHGKSGRAVFAFVGFALLSILLDIIFCVVWGDTDVLRGGADSHGYGTVRFCLFMLVANVVLKILAVFYASHLFAALGGAYSMGAGRNLTERFDTSGSSEYAPAPPNAGGQSTSSTVDSSDLAGR